MRAILVVLSVCVSVCQAALCGNWMNCRLGVDSCNSGYRCCVGRNDVSTGKATCRIATNGDCSTTTTTTAGRLIPNWQTCTVNDRCNSGYICCVATADLASGKRTCRANGSGCASVSAATSPKPVAVSPRPAAVAAAPAGFTAVNPMPSAFRGTQSGIGSWFVSNAKTSYTNGNSWCGYPYKDYTNGFAPDISQMTDWTNVDYFKDAAKWEMYGKRYCGLEAIVTWNGRSRKMYIVDAFDHAWVRTPGSIDIMKGAFTAMFGRNTENHNDVMQGVTWRLTGYRNERYKFKGAGDR